MGKESTQSPALETIWKTWAEEESIGFLESGSNKERHSEKYCRHAPKNSFCGSGGQIKRCTRAQIIKEIMIVKYQFWNPHR